MDTQELINERASTHGDFAKVARIAHDFKNIFGLYVHQDHSFIMQESLDMIATKLARILAGDGNFRDHWEDIAGYAKLVADRCTK